MDARAVVAKNLQTLMDSRASLNTIEKLVKAGAGSNGTLDRMRRGVSACRIDALADVAKAFGLEAWQLLVPNLDPEHPPALEMDSRRAELVQVELREIASRILGRPTD